MNVTLQQADLADLADIHEIRRAAILGVSPGPLSPAMIHEWADRRDPDHFAPRLTACEVLIARTESGASVGWGSCADDKITGLYVRPNSGRRGVGCSLMKALEGRIAERGYSAARLAASRNSVGFYEHLGYATTKVHDEGTHSMIKDLPTSSLRAV